ncbi:DUF4157 domain-containing protein [Nostoc sp. FACHB-152]|uniref:eCIS core domain-containing protein n=1 Tax=unclassified Nostoc TaxID=2593658 RepID=UPI0016884C7A|nr:MULTISPECIES: DUF4157 domain-containing protein [unclassified Nostoc]MBD2449737.1 DUF4157 domain-containing protein [Nostoc sp. FACHB-152]MBD2469886.1 DUF4157 domain-containing protein [Nostoc sp. FACHB-145]
MVYKKVQKSLGDCSIQKKQSQINPSAVVRQEQKDSSSAKVTNTNIPSQAQRDVIRRSIFDAGVKTVQTKLIIGQPGDKYEQEADQVAAQVVNQINSPASAQPALNENIQENTLQMKPSIQLQAGGGDITATSDLESAIAQARGGGQSLADNIREPMEQAFGADFSRVRIHTSSQADQLNRSIQAKAFTTGQDVFFRQGEYKPGSRGGQELLAHELTHVVQQTQEAIQPCYLIQRTLKSEEEIKTKFNEQEKKLLDKAREMFNIAMSKKKGNITDLIAMQTIGDIVEMMAVPTMKALYMQPDNTEVWTNVQFSIGKTKYKEPELDYLVVKDNQIYVLGSVKSNSKAFKAKTDREMYTQLRDYTTVKNKNIKKIFEEKSKTNELEVTYTVITNGENEGEEKKINWQDFQKMPENSEKLLIDLITPSEEGKVSKIQKMTSWNLDDLKQWLALGNKDYEKLYKSQNMANEKSEG